MKSRTLSAAVRSVSFDSLEPRKMFDATHLEVINQPQDATAGNSLGSIRVLLVDDDGKIATADSSNVTLAITEDTGTDGATITGTATVAANHGMATFTGLSITTAGKGYTLTASDGDLDTGESDDFDVTAGDVTGLTFHKAPTAADAGETIAPSVVVYAVDKYNNIAADDNGTVSIAVSTGPVGEALNGTVAVTADDGVATFDDLSLDTAADYKLTATQGKLTIVSDSFTISAADADHLAFSAAPKTAVAGSTLTAIKVQVLDAYGNLVSDDTSDISIALNTSPAGASLGSTTVAQTAVAGVATFDDASLSLAGAYTFSVSDGDLTAATSDSVSITPDVAAKLAFKVAPAKTVAGTSMSLVVLIEDQFGNVVTTDKSKATLALDTENSPAGAKLTGTATAAANAGAATFNGLSLTAAGSYKLKVTDGSLAGLTSETFVITPGVAAKLVFDKAPSAVVAGAAMTSVTAKVQDKFGNTITSDKSKATIAIATGPVGAALGNAATARVVSGTATFPKIVLNKAGNYTFKVLDGKLPPLISSAVAVTASTAAKVVIISGPAAAAKFVAGTKLTPIVAQVQDKYGNLVTTDASTVSAAIVGGGPLTGTMTATAVKGIATFSALQINQAGDYTLKLADASLKGAKTNSFTVNPAAAAKLLLGGSPDDMTAGTGIFPLGVFILDQYNNQVLTDTSKVTVTLTGATGAKLLGTTTVAAVKGFAGFTDLDTTLAGTDKLTFTDGKLTTALSDTFDVKAAEASKVVFGTAPVGGKAGATLTAVTAKVEDEFGNVVTNDTSDVTLETVVAPTDAVDLDGTLTQTAVAGVATFNDLKLVTAGSYTLKISDEDLTVAQSTPIAITPGTATKLAITKGPADAVAGVAFPAMTVQVQDAYDNVVATDVSKITATITTGTGTAGAVLTGVAAVAAVKGIATFSGVNITTAGEGYTIKFADGALTIDTSDAFDVTAAAAAKLVFGQAPTAAVAGAAIAPAITVKIQDKFGNLVTDNTSNVTIAVGTTVAGAVLGGTLTVAADGGIATFDDLTLDKAGSYTLKATDGALTLVLSPAFKITAAAASSVKK